MSTAITYVLLGTIAALALFALYQFGRIAIGIGAALLDRSGTQAAASYASAMDDFKREVDRLSVSVAHQRADTVLRGAGLLVVSPPSEPRKLSSDGLPPLWEEFFVRTSRVAAPRGEPYVALSDLAPFEHAKDFLRIGQADEHTHICTRPDDIRVFLLSDDSPHPTEDVEVFASVYHWLLAEERSAELLAAGPRPPV